MLFCKFCNGEYKNSNSLNNHQTRCKLNPERIDNKKFASGNRKGIPSWNSGLAGKNDPRCKISEKNKDNLVGIAKSRTSEWYKENGKKISASISKKVSAGKWHTSLAKNMHIDYYGIDLHGTWELKYALYLDAHNIKWVRNKETFEYEYSNKIRRYTPDFYLTESNEYVEIKGYKTKKDEAKWSQFPVDKKLKVLMRDELKSLGIDV